MTPSDQPAPSLDHEAVKGSVRQLLLWHGCEQSLVDTVMAAVQAALSSPAEPPRKERAEPLVELYREIDRRHGAALDAFFAAHDDCPYCHGSGEAPNAQFRCHCVHHRRGCAVVHGRGDCDCRSEPPREERAEAPAMFAALCTTLKEECERQHARAEAAEARCAELSEALRRLRELSGRIKAIEAHTHGFAHPDCPRCRQGDALRVILGVSAYRGLASLPDTEPKP